MIDPDEDFATDERLISGDVDELVAPGPAGEPAPLPWRGVIGFVVVTAGRVDAVDQAGDVEPRQRLVALEPEPLLQREEVVVAPSVEWRYKLPESKHALAAAGAAPARWLSVVAKRVAT